jgi:chromosomal replication initiator protein DnaA
MSLFPETLIEQVRRALDAVEVLRLIDYRPETIQDAKGKIKCFCPIHRETIFRTLVVDKAEGTYQCGNYSCDGSEGGDLIDLYSRARSLSYEQGVLALAEACGLNIDMSVVDGFLQTTLEVARNYLDLGALNEAEGQLSGLVSIRPDCLPALEALAELYERQNRLDLLQDTRLQLGRSLSEAGQYDQALATLQAAREQDAADVAIARQLIQTLQLAGKAEEASLQTLALANGLAGQGEVNRALDVYREAQELAQDRAVEGVDAWQPMINLLLQAGRREEAIVECMRHAEIQFKAGHREEAFESVERAIELDPDREDLHLRQAEIVALARLDGRPLNAVCDHLEKLLEARAHGIVGKALAALTAAACADGDDDGAGAAFADHPRIVCLRADLEEADGNADRALDLRLGCVDRLERAREFDNALDVLAKILAEQRGNIALLSRKANLLRVTGKVEGAIAVYLEIVELFRAIDEHENAAGIYQTVIDLQPDEMEHRRRQFELFLKLGNERVIVQKALELTALCIQRDETPEASRLLDRALEVAPESGELLERSGALYEESGRRGEAAERFLAAGRHFAKIALGDEAQLALERALRCVPEHLEAREELGGLLLARGHTLQAVAMLRDLAAFYARERQTEPAIRLCRCILKAQPDHQPTLQLLAEAHEADGNAEEQIASLIRIVDLHLRAQDWGKATQMLEEILARHDDCLPARERLVAVAEATRQGDDSIQHRWQLAQAHRRAGRQADELATLEALLATDPMHSDAWQRRIELQMQRATPQALAAAIVEFTDYFQGGGRAADAIAILEAIVHSTENPKPEIFAGLARLYRAAEDVEGHRRALRLQAELLGRLMRDAEALDAWDDLACLEPDNHGVLRMRIELLKRNDMLEDLVEEHRRLAGVLARTGHEDQARVALLEVINLRPRDLAAREQLIELMIKRGDRIGARQHIEEATAFLLEEEKGQRAIELYQRILSFDPDDLPTFRKIIALHQRCDDIPGAMAASERMLDLLEGRPDGFEFEQAAHEALQLDPSHGGLRRRLADFYVKEGRSQEAETMLLTLAVNQIDAGELESAEKSLTQLLTINPKSVPGRAHRAQLMARLGKTEDALSEFMKLTGSLAVQETLNSLIGGGNDGGGNGPATPGRPFKPAQYEGIPLVKDYTFDHFIIGERNNFAHAAAMAACRAPGKNYNPLFLYSDVGLGKTHLCHAIAHYVHDHYPEMKVRYITMEEFVTGLIDAIGNNTIASFRSWHKLIDVLIMDDVQFLSGKERAQEEFFHIFNTLFQVGKQVVLTSDRPPKDISHLEKRLKSRFGAGIIVDIQTPDLETRVAILRHELAARDRNGALSDEVLLYIAEHVETNVRELKGSLIQVLARHDISGQKIDLSAARKILEQNLSEV